MATWLGPVRQTYYYVNTSGVLVPAAGWLLFHYEPDSDTLKDTWSDPREGAGNLNTNPVVLDENGSAAIFGNGLYRQRFTNADETEEVWDRITGEDPDDDADPTDLTTVFTQPFEFLGDVPLDDEVIGVFTFDRACQIPADFDGSADGFAEAWGWQLVKPAANAVVISVTRGTVNSADAEVAIGSITVAQTTGVWTWTTTGNLPQAFDAGDYIKFTVTTPEAVWSGVWWTVPGNVL